MKCKNCGRETNPKRYNSNVRMYEFTPRYCSRRCKIIHEKLINAQTKKEN